jgi:hypothetical protein
VQGDLSGDATGEHPQRPYSEPSRPAVRRGNGRPGAEGRDAAVGKRGVSLGQRALGEDESHLHAAAGEELELPVEPIQLGGRPGRDHQSFPGLSGPTPVDLLVFRTIRAVPDSQASYFGQRDGCKHLSPLIGMRFEVPRDVGRLA